MKKTLSAFVTVLFLVFGLTVCYISFGGSVTAQAAGSKTGVGLAEHALKAYNTHWRYSYGASGQISGSSRVSDCAGLIKSYLWWTNDNSNPRVGSVSVAGGANSMLNSASVKGSINYSNRSSLPRIHGLILYQSPGHVGVYIGNNIGVDNRDYGYNIKYEAVFGRSYNKWTKWFKLPQISYPTTGWETFNGKKYYYENGQYVISTTRTIGDKTYTFDASGVNTGSTLSASALAAQKAAAQKAQAEEKAASADASQADTSSQTNSSVTSPSLGVAKNISENVLQTSAVSSEPVVINDQEIPKAAAPVPALEMQQPAKQQPNIVLVLLIVVLSAILGASVIFEKKLRVFLKKVRYVPTKDMVLSKFKKHS